MTAQIVMRLANGSLRRVNLLDETRIGSSVDSDVIADSAAVAPRHIRIKLDNGRHVLEDVSGGVGTLVNGRRVERYPLNHLDVITLVNDVDLIFLRPAAAATAVAATPVAANRAVPVDQDVVAARVAPPIVIEPPPVAEPTELGVRGGQVPPLPNLAAQTQLTAEPTVLGVRGAFRPPVPEPVTQPIAEPTVLGERGAFRPPVLETVTQAAADPTVLGGQGPPLPNLFAPETQPAAEPTVLGERGGFRPPVPFVTQPVADPTALGGQGPPRQSPNLAAQPSQQTAEPTVLGGAGGFGPPLPAAIKDNNTNSTMPGRFLGTVGGEPTVRRDERDATPPRQVVPARVPKDAPIAGVLLSGSTGVFDRPLGRLQVGRGPSADIRIQSKEISRIHAWLSVTPTDVFVEDNESANGTSVNGTPIKDKRRLIEGDRLSFATFEFRVEFVRSGAGARPSNER